MAAAGRGGFVGAADDLAFEVIVEISRSLTTRNTQYHLRMRVATGTVVSGKVVLDGPVIADGTDVYVLTRGTSDADVLSDDELAELEAGLAESDRGDMIAGNVFFAQLRRHG